MCFVAFGMAISVVLMTSDWVVPIDNIDRSVRSELHVDRPKVSVARFEDRLFPLQLEARAVIFQREPTDSVRFVVANHKVALYRFRKSATVEIADTGVAARLTDPWKATSMCCGDLPRSQPTHASRAIDTEDLSPGIVRNAPRISRSHVCFKKRSQLQSIRFETIVARVEKITRAPRRLDARFATIAVTKIELTIGTPTKRVDRLVRIAVAKAAEQYSSFVRLAVVVRVLEKQNLRILTDVDSAVAPFDPRGNI